MGAWGPGLFSDDTACDVRATYRELIEDGADDADATAAVLGRYADALADPDDGPVVWLALAHTQSKLGRLDPLVGARAIEVIDRGLDLRRWAHDTKLLACREQALAKVRSQLTGPQPARKRLSPPKRHVTSLRAGDVLVYRSPSRGDVALFRVQRIDDHRLSVAPIVRLLGFRGTSLSPARKLRRLSDWPEPPRAVAFQSPQPPWAVVAWRVSAHGGIDYAGAGFHVVGSVEPRRGDDSAKAFAHLTWSTLATSMERNFRDG